MPLLVKLKDSLFGVKEIRVEKSHVANRLCHVCMSKERKLHFLGVHFEIFQRICCFGEWNAKTVRVCWECLAMLRRVKFFQAKCFEALTKLAVNETTERSLSNLTSVVNHDTVETAPIVRGKDAPEDSSDDDNSDPIGYNDNFEVFAEEYRTEATEDDDLDETASQKVTTESVQSKDETNASELKATRKRGFLYELLKEHFVLVKLEWDQAKKYREKVKINADELKHWRGVERYSHFYVNEKYKCKKCIIGIASLDQYKEHKRRYHDESIGPYICDVCRTHFASQHHLEAHVATHYDMYRCVVCGYQCFSKRRIKWHIQKHKKTVQCVHCDATYANLSTFKKHFKAHHSVFICDHCGKKCRTKYTLEKHMKKHSEPNVCTICNKQYASRNSLRNHTELKHSLPSNAELAYCVQCDKQFPNEAVYRRHVLGSVAHAPERDARIKKEVPCPICDNVYSRKSYMMNHYRHVHMKQSRYYCADCDKAFLNRTRYVEHRKYHHDGETKARNKVCNLCGRGFVTKRTLINHIRSHSGKLRYVCIYCDGDFTQKRVLMSHMKLCIRKERVEDCPKILESVQST